MKLDEPKTLKRHKTISLLTIFLMRITKDNEYYLQEKIDLTED